MSLKMDFNNPYPSARSPVFGDEIVATSQPLASAAALEILLAGGNAVDAAIAAAMALTVVEPTGCGLGSDAFAIVWDGKKLHGLDASGRSPAGWSPDRFSGRQTMPQRGWDSVTVPGAVSGWAALMTRFGRLDMEQVAAPAIRLARDGFAVTPVIADLWRRGGEALSDQPGFADCFLPGGSAPLAGERVRLQAHANTLEAIAKSAGQAFYRGEIADQIVADARAHSAALSKADLATHTPKWVTPLSQSFGDYHVHELPPAGQGVATLMALGMLESRHLYGDGPDDPDEVHFAIEATKLAFADLNAHVADRRHMKVTPKDLLSPSYLAARASLIDPRHAGDPGHGRPGPGGTVCLSVGDRDGMMISFIQSNYMGFGSGVVVPGTGISLQNRGAGFVLTDGHPNQVGARKRPFHTIIPGFATTADGAPAMAFGLMGGPMQAQGHLQMALRILKHGQNPQAAADAPRWRVVDGRTVSIEESLSPSLQTSLAARGHQLVKASVDTAFAFGGAQIVMRTGSGYVAGSDPRKDGLALGR
uniref:Gamma-glutamyltransferase n=1 Tax=Caulobacter sp. (strain K31) TaxID=366602 RepID=B0T6N6_CAUSK